MRSFLFKDQIVFISFNHIESLACIFKYLISQLSFSDIQMGLEQGLDMTNSTFQMHE